MIAAGIDMGGTKIEVQAFDDAWQLLDKCRVETPACYDALVSVLADQIRWAEDRAGGPVPVGIGAAGLINPKSGLALTANLCATDRPLPADLARAVGRRVHYMNDCRALALSEAVFGTGRGRRCSVALILGTGIGGGVVLDGALLPSRTSVGGEFGHCSAPAHLIVEHGLPIHRCGCGRLGCIETYVAGPGLTRLAETLSGTPLTPREIAARRDDKVVAPIWTLWLDLVTDLLRNLTLSFDPDVIVLAGGLSRMSGLVPALTDRLAQVQIDGFPIPHIALAEGGDASGARGAAYAAWQESAHD